MLFSDIPTELELNGTYTGEQIIAFLCDHPDALLLSSEAVSSETIPYNAGKARKFKVDDIQQGYVYVCLNRDFQTSQKQWIFHLKPLH